MAGSSVRDIAAMNRASTREMVSHLKNLVRGNGLREPKVDFGTVSPLARRLLDTLKPHADEARLLIKKAKIRQDEGKLDVEAARVEMLPGEVTILLQEMLEEMYTRACESKNVPAMRCIRTATDIFLAHLDDNLLREGHYPKSDENLRQVLLGDRISSAREVYATVVDALGKTNDELGVKIPSFTVPLNNPK